MTRDPRPREHRDVPLAPQPPAPRVPLPSRPKIAAQLPAQREQRQAAVPLAQRLRAAARAAHAAGRLIGDEIDGLLPRAAGGAITSAARVELMVIRELLREIQERGWRVGERLGHAAEHLDEATPAQPSSRRTVRRSATTAGA